MLTLRPELQGTSQEFDAEPAWGGVSRGPGHSSGAHARTAHQKARALTADRMTDNPWQLDAGRLGSGSQGYAAFFSASLMFPSRTCDAQLPENSCEMLVATGCPSSGSDSGSVVWRSALSGPALPSEEPAGTVAGAFMLARSQPQAPGGKFQAPEPKSPEQKATSQGLCAVKSRHPQTAVSRDMMLSGSSHAFWSRSKSRSAFAAPDPSLPALAPHRSQKLALRPSPLGGPPTGQLSPCWPSFLASLNARPLYCMRPHYLCPHGPATVRSGRILVRTSQTRWPSCDVTIMG